jgi:hypothetical protein
MQKYVEIIKIVFNALKILLVDGVKIGFKYFNIRCLEGNEDGPLYDIC